MKKYIFALAAVVAGLSMQSCSLHDETDTFGKPAAERMEETIKADKQLLESASNGWQLEYYTGEEYTGGGYTYLLKFNNGSVTASGDMADEPDTKETSSYDIIADQSAVLTFDTHNSLLHKFATPTSSSIDGDQGDYEFVIQKTTQDSIFLKGKKWGNKMVMTRLPENISWEARLDSIMKVANGIRYNNKLMQGNDSIGYLSVDDYTRRAVLKKGSDSIAVSYVVEPNGIHFQKPFNVEGVEISQMAFDRNTDELHVYMNSANLDVKSYVPVGYKPLSFFLESAWTLVTHAADENNKETQTVKEYRIEFRPYSPVYLKANINVDGLAFDLYFQYFRDKGAIALVQQYADDPTKTYAYANVAPVSFSAEGRFNWVGDLLGFWNEQTQQIEFKWNGVGAAAIDSYVFLATNNSGQPVYDSSNNLISLGAITYIKSMKQSK